MAKLETFTYDIDIPATGPEEAFEKLTAASKIIEHLDTGALKLLAETVSSPMKLAIVKMRLGIK